MINLTEEQKEQALNALNRAMDDPDGGVILSAFSPNHLDGGCNAISGSVEALAGMIAKRVTDDPDHVTFLATLDALVTLAIRKLDLEEEIGAMKEVVLDGLDES